jgi:hypothetical protein
MQRPIYAAGGAGGRDQPGTEGWKASAFAFLQMCGREQSFPVSALGQMFGSEQSFPVFGLGQTRGLEQSFPVLGLGQTAGCEQFLPVLDLVAVSSAGVDSRISR